MQFSIIPKKAKVDNFIQKRLRKLLWIKLLKRNEAN